MWIYLSSVLLLGLGIIFPESALADQMHGLRANIQTASTSINANLVNVAIKTAAAALALQWILTHWKELFSGELSSILAKSVGMISWFGITYWLLDNQDKFKDFFLGYLTLGGSISGNPVGFDPAMIVGQGIEVIINLDRSMDTLIGATPWYSVITLLPEMFTMLFAMIFIFIAYLVVALNVFIALIEFWLLFAVAPLAFALIPLSAFRDQGFAPIKGAISLGLRLVILAMIIAIMQNMSASIIAELQRRAGSDGAAIATTAGIFTHVWDFMAGMAACAMMSLMAGKIASSIASGSASFSGADAVRGAMNMGTMAAAGTAAVAGTAAAGGVAAGSMRGAMSGMMGGSAGRGDVGIAPSSGGSSGSGPVSPGGSSGLGGKIGDPPPPPGAGNVFKSMGDGGGSGSGSDSGNSGGGSRGDAVSNAVLAEGGSPSAAKAAKAVANAGGSAEAIMAAVSNASPENASFKGAAANAAAVAALEHDATSGKSASPAGNASGAGITGGHGGSPMSAKDIADAVAAAMAPKPKGAKDHLKDVAESGRRGGDALSQDTAPTSISMNSRGDG